MSYMAVSPFLIEIFQNSRAATPEKAPLTPSKLLRMKNSSGIQSRANIPFEIQIAP
jgi:hypothetical protein